MKAYETPKFEVVSLTECDILTASNGTPLLPYSWFEENADEQELV
jgi:hypothetical protein